MESSRNNLLEALKQVERRTENSASGWRLLLYGAILTPVFLLAPAIFVGADLVPQDVASLAWVMLGFGILLLFFSMYFGWDTRSHVCAALSDSTIAERIASGVLLDDPVFQATPWPWRTLLPGTPASQDTQTVILRVAWNLDWYLRDPDRLWRISWLYFPMAMGAAAYLLYVLIQLASSLALYGLPSFPTQKTVQAIAAVLVMLPATFLHYRRQIWTEELVRHLRERLQA